MDKRIICHNGVSVNYSKRVNVYTRKVGRPEANDLSFLEEMNED